jgi:GNAT superfamily N-acetyltransferase
VEPLIDVRPAASDAEQEASLAIYNAVWPRDAVTMDEVRSFQATVIDYADFVARLDRSLAGSAFVAVTPHRPDVGFALVTVLAEHRGRGVGVALYRDLSAWLRAHGIYEVEAPVAEDDPASLAFAERRGFAEIERDSRLVLALNAIDAPRIVPPAGVEIVSWAERPELARGIYEVACEAYADIPGHEHDRMEPFEDWLAHDMQGSGDRPEATFVAVAGGDVVGYSKFSLTAARPKVAAHDITGVKRAWRGRGIARALKQAQIAWAKRAGYERLETHNEQRNEPIRRLNEGLGYKLEPGRILLRGPVA